MKIYYSILMLLLFSLSAIAQKKSKIGLAKPAGQVEQSDHNKGDASDYVSKEEARCNVVWNNYKILLRHVLNKSENETLDLSSIMPHARVRFNPNVSPDLFFRKVPGTMPFLILGTHFVQPPNGVYTVAVEMVSHLHQDNSGASILSFAYEEDDYEHVVEVLDVFKASGVHYIKIRRSNGVVEDIRYFPNHIIDNCTINTL